MMVRFATTCDVMLPGPIGLDRVPCGTRSDEYGSHATCRLCGSHVCEEHYATDTLRYANYTTDEGVDVERPTVYCDNCAADGPEEE